MDWRTHLGGTIRYHASRNWLLINSYPIEKLNSVEISDVQAFLFLTWLNSPNLMLHEIAHLYHVTSLTVHYEPIYQAFLDASNTGVYNQGNDNVIEDVPAHVISDQLNYFSELTEAYFGTNDYFPFNREQLRAHDPQGFAVIEQVWKE